jgi:hypothetical protein
MLVDVYLLQNLPPAYPLDIEDFGNLADEQRRNMFSVSRNLEIK